MEEEGEKIVVWFTKHHLLSIIFTSTLVKMDDVLFLHILLFFIYMLLILVYQLIPVKLF